MARLPIPGSDSGSWGQVLNNYLLVSHANDGTLNAGVVGTTQLQNNSVGMAQLQANSVGSAQLQNGAVGVAALGPNVVSTTNIVNNSVTAAKLDASLGLTDSLRSLLIFYATPDSINAQFNQDYSAGILSRYTDVVLGSGLENPSNSDYANTTAIMSKLAALSPSTVVWGYIDTGVTTANYPLSTLQTQIDQWVAIGAKGIFLDVFGYDFHVPRSRQNAILDYVHSKGIGAIMNVFTASDALGSQVNATYNPTGTPTHANGNDVLLLESWVCNSDAYASPYYATFSDIKTRVDIARGYRNTLGIRIFAANIISQSLGNAESYRSLTEAFARSFRLDGSGIAGSQYSAVGADIGVVNPRFSYIPPTPYRPNAPYILNNPWTQITSPDLGLVINFNPGTSTFNWVRQ